MKAYSILISSALRLIQFKIFASLLLFALSFTLQAQDHWGKAKGPFTGHVTSMVVTNNGILYACTWGGGVFKSLDNGANWAESNTGLTNNYVNHIKSATNGHLYISTQGSGIFRSTNNGNSWEEINDGLTNKNVRLMEIKPDGKLIAGTYGGGIYISADTGKSWNAMNMGLYHLDIIAIGFTKNANYILAATNGSGLYRSSDNGAFWIKANVEGGTQFIHGFMNNSVGDVYAASNGNGMIISVDNGLSWKEYDTNRVDKNLLCFVMNQNNEPIVGTLSKGVLYYDEQNYEDWLRSNIVFGGVTALAVSPVNGFIFAAQPFEGILRSTNNGRKFDYVGFKYDKGVKAVAGSKRSTVAYASFNNNGVHISTDNGRNWAAAGLDGQTVNVFAFDSSDNIYAGTNRGIFKSTNKGVNWAQVGPQDSVIYGISIKSDGTMFAVGSHFYKSVTGGPPWTITNPTGMDETFWDIGIHGSGRIFITGASQGSYVSTNDGNSWQRVIDNNTSGEARAVTFDNAGNVYVGAYKGLFRSTNNGQNWTRDTLGARYPFIKALNKTATGKLIAGFDYGEGSYFSTNNGTAWDSTNNGFVTAPIADVGTDADGYTWLATDVVYKAIDSAKLAPPLPNLPADFSIGVDINPVLSWSKAKDAELYELQLSIDSTFGFRNEFVIQADTFRIIETKLDYFSKCFWRVRSKLHSTVGPWSELRHFVTGLEPPVLISPTNGKKGVAQNPVMLWHSIAGALDYSIEVATDAGFSNIVFTKSGIKDTTVNVTGLKPLTTYYWHIRGRGSLTISTWSIPWQFETVVASPVLRFPENHSSEHPTDITFRWDTSLKATKYYIQISLNSDFTTTIFEGQTETVSSHRFNLLEYDTKYYWRIYAENQDGKSSWTEVWDFTTGIEPPVLISPENGTKNLSLTYSFRWEGSQKASAYHLQIAEDNEFKKIVFEDSGLTDESALISDLGGFKDYFWRLRIKSGNRNGFWCAPWTFKTMLAPPILTYPADKDTAIDINLYLKWEKSNGASKYFIQVATDELFTNIIKEIPQQSDNEQSITKLEYKTVYYWRVKAINSESESEWTIVRSFETKTKPTSVEVLPEIISSIELYPLPAKDKLKIRIDLASPVIFESEILDIFGNTVHEYNINEALFGINIIEIDISKLSQGSYTLWMRVGQDKIARSIIILK